MNRRTMIKQLLSLGAAGFALDTNKLLADQLKADGQRLILLELAGANDGLNTLVPYSDNRYYRLRLKLAYPNQRSSHLTLTLLCTTA